MQQLFTKRFATQKEASLAGEISLASISGVPNLGYNLNLGKFKVSNKREKYIYILFISKYLYIYQ